MPTLYGFSALADFMGGVLQGQFINLWTTGGVDFYISKSKHCGRS